MKTCPHCAENGLQNDAKVCKHCGKQIRRSKYSFAAYLLSFRVLISLIGGYFFWPLWIPSLFFFLMGQTTSRNTNYQAY